jgi:hypothetical protein
MISRIRRLSRLTRFTPPPSRRYPEITDPERTVLHPELVGQTAMLLDRQRDRSPASDKPTEVTMRIPEHSQQRRQRLAARLGQSGKRQPRVGFVSHHSFLCRCHSQSLLPNRPRVFYLCTVYVPMNRRWMTHLIVAVELPCTSCRDIRMIGVHMRK